VTPSDQSVIVRLRRKPKALICNRTL